MQYKANADRQELALKILPATNRVSAEDFTKLLKEDRSTLLIDVRSEPEFSMCHIEGAENVPIESVEYKIKELVDKVGGNPGPVVFICRRGNDSQIAAKILLDKLPEEDRHKIKDMVGGLHAWAECVDKSFPVY